MTDDENIAKLAQVSDQIRKHVSGETANRYMDLAQQWVSGTIRADQFDRRGQRLNIPENVHTRFMLEIGELFNLAFDNSPTIKPKKRKQKDSESSTAPNIGTSGSLSKKQRLSGLSGNELSTKLLLFALTNRVYSEASLMDTSPNMHDRTQDFVNNVLFYAGLTKTPHQVNELGFIIPESPIDYKTVNESDVRTALTTYDFLISDDRKRQLLIDSLSSNLSTLIE